MEREIGIEKKVRKQLKENINKNNSIIIEQINEQKLTLCVGTGISADLNKEVNNHTYLWNGLVYGIAGELLKDDLIDLGYIGKLYENKLLSPKKTSEKEYIKYISTNIEKLVHEEQFLNSDNTMECVEYLKYIAFPHEKGAPEEDYAENVIALISNELLNRKRELEEKARGEDPIEKKIKIQNEKSYDKSGNYKKGKGRTLIEVVKLLQNMDNPDVLTYNYDDFLETALRVLGEGRSKKIYSIFNERQAEEFRVKKGIHIYHVHGFTPKNWTKEDKRGDFIFSENSYSHMSDEIYRWPNRIQAEFFSQKNILFIGFSGVDTNFRRLMKAINKEHSRISNSFDSVIHHIMFMNYGDIIDKICKTAFSLKDLPREISEKLIIEVVTEIVRDIINAKDKYYRGQLGIELLWYDDVSKIPDILNQITEKIREN